MPDLGELRRVRQVIKVKAPNGNNVWTEVETLQQYQNVQVTEANDLESQGPRYEMRWVDVPLVDGKA